MAGELMEVVEEAINSKAPSGWEEAPKNLLAPLIFPISGRELAPVPRSTLGAVVVASPGPSLGHSR